MGSAHGRPGARRRPAVCEGGVNVASLAVDDGEYKLLYSILVAGKKATFAEKKMRSIMVAAKVRGDKSLFEYIERLAASGNLGVMLRWWRTGRYGLIERAFRAVVSLHPGTCTLEELEAVPGIGPKTARFFLLWSRPFVRKAALDVHILHWLRDQGYDAPKQTPPAGRTYRRLEEAFLSEADKRGKTARELDWEIWAAYSQRWVK